MLKVESLPYSNTKMVCCVNTKQTAYQEGIYGFDAQVKIVGGSYIVLYCLNTNQLCYVKFP